ncbi:hypothetical protein IWX91DRAFT_333122 [Phyllosticta citricarpa]
MEQISREAAFLMTSAFSSTFPCVYLRVSVELGLSSIFITICFSLTSLLLHSFAYFSQIRISSPCYSKLIDTLRRCGIPRKFFHYSI